MTHDELRDSLPAFALGALDPDEHADVSAHVATCPSCTAEVAALGRVVDQVGLEAPPVTPPATLRARVLARVAAEQAAPVTAKWPVRPASPSTARSFWNSGLALAASLALAIGASVYAFSLHTELIVVRDTAATSSAQASRLREEIASLRRDRVSLDRAMEVLRAPDTLRVQLKGQAGAAAATGHALWSRTAGLVFTADRMPALPADRIYQLWTIIGTAATSAGTFALDGSGSAAVTFAVSADATRPDAFGVTIEPGGGSATPTLPIVLLGSAR